MDSSIVFIKQAIRHFRLTGSVYPTSTFAGRKLIEPLRKSQKSMHILEAGAGNGSISKLLVQEMGDEDTLTLCELNPALMSILKERVTKNPQFKDKLERIRFYEGSIETLTTEHQFDFVCCTLPFLNFTPKKVDEIMNFFIENTSEDALMTYIQYLGISKVSSFLLGKEYRDRQQLLKDIFREHFQQRLAKRKHVFLNFPPAKIETIYLNSEIQSSYQA